MSVSLKSTENLLKAIIVQFCKQNFTYESSLRVVGSIHVVVDNNEVMACLLNETQQATTKTVVQQQPASVQSVCKKPTPVAKSPLQPPPPPPPPPSQPQQPLATKQTKTNSSPANRVNKRKRFAPTHLSNGSAAAATAMALAAAVAATNLADETNLQESSLYDEEEPYVTHDDDLNKSDLSK